MTPFFRNKRLIILLVSSIILIVLIGYTIQTNRSLTLPEQFMQDTAGFFQRIIKVPTQFVADIATNINELGNLREENIRLKAQIDENLELAQRATALEQDNEELRSLLEISEEDLLSSYTPIIATVIARSPDQWNNFITINRGQTDGIDIGMAVKTAQGLIGRVRTVAQFTATVQLLSDGSSINRTSASVQGESNIFGIIEGYDESGEYLLFKNIPSEASIQEGQIVVTSGLSDIFPENVIIGTVVRTEQDEFGLTQTAFVEPAANFYEINHVVVLDRMARSEEDN